MIRLVRPGREPGDATARKPEAELDERFVRCDREHPMVRELYRLCLARIGHSSPPARRPPRAASD